MKARCICCTNKLYAESTSINKGIEVTIEVFIQIIHFVLNEKIAICTFKTCPRSPFATGSRKKHKTRESVGNGNLIKFEINPRQITSEVENLIY